jgi:hypothetical protein
MPALLIAAAESARFPLAMLLIFGSAKLLAELFERFLQPGIAGEILAGVLIGPSALGWIAPNCSFRSSSRVSDCTSMCEFSASSLCWRSRSSSLQPRSSPNFPGVDWERTD